MNKHFVKIYFRSCKTTVKVEWGTIYEEEFDQILDYLIAKGKTWKDINAKTVTYVSGNRIPYKCGGSAVMHTGPRDINGYMVLFRLHGEKAPKKEAKPNQKYGRREN